MRLAESKERQRKEKGSGSGKKEDSKRIEPLKMQLFPKEECADRRYLKNRKGSQTGQV